MTFNPNVPNASESPGLFPVQCNTNFARLKTIINKDHVFNNSAQATDGVHRQATMVARADPVALPAGTNGILYTWLDSFAQAQLKYWNGTSYFQVTPGIVANVNFNGINGFVGIRSQLNVALVTRTGVGAYQIDFTTAMPNTNYIVQVTGMRDATSNIVFGMVRGDSVYSNSVSTTFVKVQFISGSSGSPADVFMGNVTIMRYS